MSDRAYLLLSMQREVAELKAIEGRVFLQAIYLLETDIRRLAIDIIADGLEA